MSNHNLEVLLEKSNMISLGIRSRQAGITLKEYFLNQKTRAKNILSSQKAKLGEALSKAHELSTTSTKNANSSISLLNMNKAGKRERVHFSSEGSTAMKVFGNLRKIATQIYSIIKYRCSEIVKRCNAGINKASSIIKGKSTDGDVLNAKTIRSEISELNTLLNVSLGNMRELFKSFYITIR